MDKARLGNKDDGSWTYNNIVDAFWQSGLVGIWKHNVKNRQKSLKDRRRKVHDLFSGLSIFAQNEAMKLLEAEEETWDDLIKVMNEL